MEYMCLSTSCLQIPAAYMAHVMTCIPLGFFLCVLNPIEAHSNCLLTPITFVISSVLFCFANIVVIFNSLPIDSIGSFYDLLNHSRAILLHVSFSLPLSISRSLAPSSTFSSIFFSNSNSKSKTHEIVKYWQPRHLFVVSFILHTLQWSIYLYENWYGIYVCVSNKQTSLSRFNLPDTLFWLHNTRQVTDSILICFSIEISRRMQ